MPFKIVSTRKGRGTVELCTVPSHWEKNGKLKWPRQDAYSLSRDENSKIDKGWATWNCTLKRNNLLTYDEAEEELTNMLGLTDTDNDQSNGRGSMRNSTMECPNLNAMAQSLIVSSVETENNGTSEQNSNSVITDNVFYEVIPNTQQPDNIGEPLLQQIQNMYEIQKAILDNQEKIMKKLSELSVQLEELPWNRELSVTTLSQAEGMQTKRMMLKAIDNIQDLQQLDTELSTSEGFESLQEKYSILCSVQRGNGMNCAYRLLDALFTKDFLCKCSWTGGSRKSDVKIGFKGYKNIVKFFFVMVNTWDDTYTMENNEEFLKTVLRNALKRKTSKDIRLSAPKKRVKKNISEKNEERNAKKGKKDKENEPKTDNENGTGSNEDKLNGPENNVLSKTLKPQNQSGENRQAQKKKEKDEVGV